MKITDLKVTLFEWPIEPWKTGKGNFGGNIQLGLVAVKTDDGLEGHCFLGSPMQGADAHAGPLMSLVKPKLIGRSPLDRGAIWQDMWDLHRVVDLKAIGAVDVALWDLAGRAAGLPVHRLLGSCKHQIPAYASSAWLPTPAAYGEEAVHYKELGWTAYKTHPHGIPGADMAICRAIREAVGDDMVLMLDAQWAFGYEDALRVGRAIEELGYFWYEDPLAEEDIYNYTKLRQKLDIPLLNTEYAPGGYYAMAQWVHRQATDMLRGDVAVNGGITPLMRIAHLADAFHMKCEIHHGGNSLNNIANLHVTMAIPNCDYYEVFPADGRNKYGLLEDIEVDESGMVHAPESPGLGFEIDWDLVKRRTTQVLE